MNNHTIKLFIPAMILGLGLCYSCQKNEMPATETNDISFTLGGSAKLAGSQGEDPRDNEYGIDEVYALLFKDNILQSMEEVSASSENCSFSVKESGLYDMIFLIDPSESLTGTFESLVGKEMEDLKSIVYNMDPSDVRFMFSENMSANVDGKKACNLGEVEFKRPVSRIDVINAVDGLTVNRISFTNLASSDNIFREGNTGRETEYTDKTYEDLDFNGSSSSPACFSESTYSLQNSGQTSTSVEIGYSINGIKFTAEADLPEVLMNHRYSLVLLAKDQSYSSVGVKTWYSPEGTVIPLETEVAIGPVDNQKELNEALAVNIFVKEDVSSIIDEKVVEFANEAASGSNSGNYFKWQAKWTTKVFLDADGQRYRIPDADEMSILLPKEYNLTRFDEAATSTDIPESLPISMFDGQYSGGDGTSDFISIASASENPAGHVVYAIRFKGTPQAAAYRYEWKDYGQNSENARLEIRIKGIGKDRLPSLQEVSNESYWESEYLDYTLSADGYAKEGQVQNQGIYGYYWTISSYNDRSAYALSFFKSTSDIYWHPISNEMKLKMVRTTREPEEEEGQDEKNARLVASRIEKYFAVSFDEASSTVVNATDEFVVGDYGADGSLLILWNEAWPNKTYTENGSSYRIMTADEMRLAIPDNDDYVSLEEARSELKDCPEFLPEKMFSQETNGGSGLSDFISVAENGGFVTYAIRFKGTLQRAAYKYELLNDDIVPYMSVKIKALDDDYTTLEQISNAAYWEGEYLQICFPLLGKTNFRGTLTGYKDYGNYWAAAGEGDTLTARNCYIGAYTAMDALNPGAKDGKVVKLIRID